MVTLTAACRAVLCGGTLAPRPHGLHAGCPPHPPESPRLLCTQGRLLSSAGTGTDSFFRGIIQGVWAPEPWVTSLHRLRSLTPCQVHLGNLPPSSAAATQPVIRAEHPGPTPSLTAGRRALRLAAFGLGCRVPPPRARGLSTPLTCERSCPGS